jgi:hypothetical protein
MKTHPLNVTHLTIGLILLGLSGIWAIEAAGWADGLDGTYLVPLLFIGAGVISLAAFALRGSRRPTTHDSEEYPS